MQRFSWVAWVFLVAMPWPLVGVASRGPDEIHPWPASLGITLTNFRSLGPGGGGTTFSAVIHNTNPDIILAGQDVGGVMRTSDGGATWRHVNQGGMSGTDRDAGVYGVPGLFAHPTRDDVFFAGTWDGLFRSLDAGITWTLVLGTVGPVDAVAVSPGDPDTVIAGTGDWHFPDGHGAGLFRSVDGGASFMPASATGLPENAQYASLAFDPASGDLWAATSSGLMRSSDLGEHFTKVSGGFRHDRGLWIEIAGETTGSQTFSYVLETTGDEEDGSDWKGGVYRSANGASWSELPDAPLIDPFCEGPMRAQGAAFDSLDPSILYMNMRTDSFCGGFYRYDGTWTDLFADLENPTHTHPHFRQNPAGLAVSKSDPNRIVVCDDMSIHISDDRGATFRLVSVTQPSPGLWSGTGAEVTFAYQLASTAGVLYAGFEDIGTWRSNDRGDSWKQVTWHENPSDLDGGSEITVKPNDPDRLYVAASSWSNGLRENDSDSEIIKSVDGGATTTIITPSVSGKRGRAAMAVVWGATPADDVLYAAFHGGSVYKSVNGGTSWTRIAQGFSGSDDEMVFRITVDPMSPQTVYAGLFTNFGEHDSVGGLYRSTNAGASWQRLSIYPWQDVVHVGFEGTPSRLFVGGWQYDSDKDSASGALMVSDDGGVSFTTVLVQPFPYDVVEQPSHPGTLFAASGATYVRGEGQVAGIYRSTDNGSSWERIPVELPHNVVFDLHFTSDDPNRLYMATGGDGVVSAVVVETTSRRHPVRRP